ncbi:DgyrCDS275 [Dimorphilus gyrociliatus]|uniref:DgyrCDS275 n=1 Tax=Dimorphilus gyrociliatus TaxID=2664684 RepID=A0A7I8V4A7_9ANNE|nr:DgyrCDS275 [Dimorphilus gyrociliatus]
MNPLLSDERGEGQQAGFPSRRDYLEKLLTKEAENDYLRSFNLQRYLGAMNNKDREMSGHKLENMLVECSEYLPFYQNSVGFRISIHDAEDYPFPESKGFNVPPGHLTYVGLRKIHTILKPKPYSRCELLSKLQMEDRDAYVGQLPHVTYSESSCMKTCFQIELIRRCRCQDPSYPRVMEVRAFSQLLEELGLKSEEIPYCRLFDKREKQCLKWFNELFIGRKVSSNEEIVDKLCNQCLPECDTITYHTTLSSGIYNNLEHFRNTRNQNAKIKYKNLKNDKIRYKYLEDNIVAISIYLEDLEQEDIQSDIDFSALSYIADMGGILGLWMGLSILTVFEICECLYDIFYNMIFCQKMLEYRLPDVNESLRRKIQRRIVMNKILSEEQDRELDLIFIEHVWKKANLPFNYMEQLQNN